MTEWKGLFVPDEILKALEDQKFAKPTVIQSQALPSAIRDRKDILGAAETVSVFAFTEEAFTREDIEILPEVKSLFKILGQHFCTLKGTKIQTFSFINFYFFPWKAILLEID